MVENSHEQILSQRIEELPTPPVYRLSAMGSTRTCGSNSWAGFYSGVFLGIVQYTMSKELS